MNKKGFTLIEILGVIIILSLIIALVFPNILGGMKNADKEITESQKKLLDNAVDLYLDDNYNTKKDQSGTVYCVSISELIDKGYISKEEVSDNKDKNYKIELVDENDEIKVEREIIDSNQVCNENVTSKDTTPPVITVKTLYDSNQESHTNSFSINVVQGEPFKITSAIANDEADGNVEVIRSGVE